MRSPNFTTSAVNRENSTVLSLLGFFCSSAQSDNHEQVFCHFPFFPFLFLSSSQEPIIVAYALLLPRPQRQRQRQHQLPLNRFNSDPGHPFLCRVESTARCNFLNSMLTSARDNPRSTRHSRFEPLKPPSLGSPIFSPSRRQLPCLPPMCDPGTMKLFR